MSQVVGYDAVKSFKENVGILLSILAVLVMFTLVVWGASKVVDERVNPQNYVYDE